MDKYTGKRLDGRYEIHEAIGMGGMAVVYRAYDTLDNRTVAVKILKDEYSQNEEFLRRFRNESKAIAMLSHPNIVKVYDVSIGDQIQYIVEEYIDGITLKEYLDQQKQIKWKEAIHFVVQILRALEHAHSKGIIHRDIKPQNIMLLQDGTIKVTDFGIARLSHNETRTMTGKAIGSVHYIAPEQARGDYTDEKTDIYSVGVMLYEMLTGKLPFEADNAVSVAIMQLQTDPKPLREINPDVPEGLEEITLKAMQKDPKQRYQSAADMLRDIEEFRRNPSARFQYKYFIDEKPTKYIDAIDSARNSDQPYYNDNYDYVENGEESAPVKKKKKPVAAIIAGIAVAFLIVAVAIGISAFMKNKNTKPQDIIMPSFVGKSYSDVVASSTSSNSFQFKKQDKNDSTHAAGIIISQNPAAGTTVKSNADVTLIVSTGIAKVTMPDLSGQTKDQAEQALTNLGLKYSVTKVADDNMDKENVVSTDPAAGTQVNKGTEVKLYVSSGKDDQKVAVPDVSGDTVQNAESEILAAGLTVGSKTYRADADHEKDTVISSNPLNGVKVSKGSSVNLVISSGQPTQESKAVNVYVDLPRNTTNDITLKAYLDGVLTDTRTVNSSYNPTTQLTYSGLTGKHTLIISLDDGKYREYSLDFSAGKSQLNQSYNYTPPPSSSSQNQSSKPGSQPKRGMP